MVFLYTLSWAVSDMAIYFIESKYKEIFKLKQMLEKEKIPFDFTCTSYPESNFIHYHLEYPNKFDMDGSRIVSVVEGIGSYGREADKLEIMGLLTPEEAERDSVAGWLTADELERALKEFVQELVTMKKTEEEYRETPKCPICGHRGYNIREIGSDGFNTYVIMTCRNCETEIRTDKEKIDRFFLERLVQDIEK